MNRLLAIASSTAVIFALSVVSFSMAWGNDEETNATGPSASSERQLPESTPRDLSQQVEIAVTGSLRSNRVGDLFVGVTVKNISDEPIKGRLVLVVDETGIENVRPAAGDGTLESGESYWEIQSDKATLRPGRKTRAVKIDFTAPGRVLAAQRKEFALVARVLLLAPEEPHESDSTHNSDDEENLPGKNYSQAELDHVMAVQNKWTVKLLAHEGVVGTATTENPQGEPVVQVMTLRRGIIKELPGKVDGVDLEQNVVGDFYRAGPAWTHVVQRNGKKVIAKPNSTPGAPGDPTQRFDRPVPIGVSIFNIEDDCAAGTLGCRVVDASGTLYILSNAHVIAQEIDGVIGEGITQPGCLDSASGMDEPGDVIATLSDFQLLTEASDMMNPALGPINSIDAAIAQINDPALQLVDAHTPTDGYGFPSRTPVPPRLGLRVHKYGRTTGYRQGVIRSLNVNVPIAYGNLNLVYFVGQIGIQGDQLVDFSQAGDSGSLIVTINGNNPVGLLFAGGGADTIANPIQLVLDRFNVAVDDGTSVSPPAGPSTSGRMGHALGPNDGLEFFTNLDSLQTP